MATAPKAGSKEVNFSWEGKNKTGKVVRGNLRAETDSAARAALRRQGILTITKLKKQKVGGGGR